MNIKNLLVAAMMGFSVNAFADSSAAVPDEDLFKALAAVKGTIETVSKSYNYSQGEVTVVTRSVVSEAGETKCRQVIKAEKKTVLGYLCEEIPDPCYQSDDETCALE